MAFSVNTNIASLQAEDYIRINSDFQAKTISRVTSGLRIVQSGDDAAGLAIANGFRSDEAVLTQGIRNANDGLSQLQIIDGGLNNISKLLDRARTLATQSASGTFTGDRGVLNSEFQSVLAEIDRQAQAIGLDPNGALAKNLSVFIGGGRTNNGTTATSNGSVGLDLSGSTVDSKSLGLKGVQVVGNSSVDLSAGSATNVQSIVSDLTNAGSEAVSGFTNFYFAGPGFSDASKIKVSVNLNGVNDSSTLVSALNAALQNAGNGVNSSATAFKNAGVTASISTDANGAQHLAFTSGTAAFQVEAGDRTANALLGNIASGVTGAALSTTVTASAATTSGSSTATTVRFQGSGLTSPVDISIASGLTTANAIASLSSQIANNGSLKAAGITLTTSSGTLQFTSAHGEKFNVTAAGDTQNLLGLGSFGYGASSAVDYTSTTAAGAPTLTSAGRATVEFSLNGGASGAATTAATTTGTALAGNTVNTGALGTTTLALNIDGAAVTVDFANDPNKGAAENITDVAKYINTTVRTALGLGASVNVATADTTAHTIALTSPTSGTASTVSVTAGGAGTAATLFGFAAGASVAGTGSAVNTVSISLAGGTATAATASGSAIAGTVDTTAGTLSGGTVLAFTVDGNSVSADFATDANKGATESLQNIAKFLNGVAQKQLGTSQNVVSIVNNKLTITSNTTGAESALVITDGGANSASRAIGLTTASNVSATGTGPTAADLAGRLNQAFAANSNLQTAGLQASVSSGNLTVASTNGTYFQLLERGVAGTDLGFGVTGAAFTGNAASAAPSSSPVTDAGGSYQSQAYAFTGLSHGNDDQTITIASDATGTPQSQTIHLRNNTIGRNARTIDEAISTINAQLQQSNLPSLQKIVAVKDDSSGVEQIKFLGSNAFSVSIGSNANATGFGSQNTTTTATQTAGGSTSDISTQGNAQAAVTTLLNSVSTLGKSQAVVGKGQNQFTYAVNLAQSQLSNLAASESRIRDADLAAEAANLTKSQIVLQAGIAALAQANSAPQAILSLLKA